MAKRGLGRGFDSLIPAELLDESFDPTADQDDRISDLRQIKLAEIMPDPTQPRRVFDETLLDELAESIRVHGVLQPIVVTPDNKGKYVIVAGERRYRAATKAGLEKIPALVRTLSDQHKLELSLIENIQRQNLNAIETATAYLKLRDQFNLTLEQIGQRVGGKSPSAVSNTLRLLRLPEVVRQAVVDGKLSEGQVRPLISLDEAQIADILPKIIQEEWSARRIEQYLAILKRTEESDSAQKTAKAQRPAPPPQYTAASQRFEQQLSAPVQIRGNRRGAGQIVIRFTSDDDFERIIGLLEHTQDEK
ncbi:MAG: ParB/RepB/Spo0J family partition protein [Candidatus Nanosynbacter sp.]|jgi:parBc, parB-like nuclease domain|nr:ParB/RepB/Spo0J family partition protein [Candidatus Nanosynbacter sp.]